MHDSTTTTILKTGWRGLMNIDNYLIADEEQQALCRIMLQVLRCDVLWLMTIRQSTLTILASDVSILEHYLRKKYYLQDPNVSLKPHPKASAWNRILGSYAEGFKKSGFLYELHTLFKVEDCASIEQSIQDSFYCFRFFTKNNRFVFMNQLINNKSFIKLFMNAMIGKVKDDLYKQPGIRIDKLKPELTKAI